MLCPIGGDFDWWRGMSSHVILTPWYVNQWVQVGSYICCQLFPAIYVCKYLRTISLPFIARARMIKRQTNSASLVWSSGMLSPCRVEFIFRKHKLLFAFPLTFPQWEVTGSWNLSAWNSEKNCFSCKFLTIAGDARNRGISIRRDSDLLITEKYSDVIIKNARNYCL